MSTKKREMNIVETVSFFFLDVNGQIGGVRVDLENTSSQKSPKFSMMVGRKWKLAPPDHFQSNSIAMGRQETGGGGKTKQDRRKENNTGKQSKTGKKTGGKRDLLHTGWYMPPKTFCRVFGIDLRLGQIRSVQSLLCLGLSRCVECVQLPPFQCVKLCTVLLDQGQRALHVDAASSVAEYPAREATVGGFEVQHRPVSIGGHAKFRIFAEYLQKKMCFACTSIMFGQ